MPGPSGRKATFTVDLGRQVVSAVSADVNGSPTTIASGITYAPLGSPTSLLFGNGLLDSRSYDSRYRLQDWTLGGLISKTYSWADDDTITGITDNLNSANNRSFGSDSLHRLVTANGPWGSGSYSYDDNGNRLTKVLGSINVSYSYTAGTNRVASATGSEPATYAYDANGAITGDGTHVYQFSDRERLAGVDTGTTATYLYDADGRRVQKTAGGTTTLYFYDQAGRLLEEYDPATGTGKDYIRLPGLSWPLARVDLTMTESALGNVLMLTKSGSSVHLDWSADTGTGPYVVPPLSDAPAFARFGSARLSAPAPKQAPV